VHGRGDGLPVHVRCCMLDSWLSSICLEWSGNIHDPSNRAELNFEESNDKIWYDESDVSGRKFVHDHVSPRWGQ
jgi:hypothetical protein